jgi:hypothetical protein
MGHGIDPRFARGGRGAGRDGASPPRTSAPCPLWCASRSRSTTGRCTADGLPGWKAGRHRKEGRVSRRRPAGPDGRVAVIGLPDSVRACLFDLDGVLTRTASRAATGCDRSWPRGASSCLRASR